MMIVDVWSAILDNVWLTLGVVLLIVVALVLLTRWVS